MENSVLVSVVIPTYKRSQELQRAIESVKNQNFKSFNVIVVDDNDDNDEIENVVRICDKYGVDYVKNFRIKGGCGARNSGVLKSNAKYISFLDDDDVWLDSKLKEQLNFMESNPQFSAVYCGFISSYKKQGFYITNPNGEVLTHKKLLEKKCPSSTSLMTVNRQLMLDSGLFDESLPSFQDYDMWLRLTKHKPIGFQNKILAVFTQHDGDRVSVNLQKRFTGLNMIVDKWGSELRNFNSLSRFIADFRSAAYSSNAQSVAGSNYFKYVKFRYLSFINSKFNFKVFMIFLLSFFGGSLYIKMKKIKAKVKNANTRDFNLILKDLGLL